MAESFIVPEGYYLSYEYFDVDTQGRIWSIRDIEHIGCQGVITPTEGVLIKEVMVN